MLVFGRIKHHRDTLNIFRAGGAYDVDGMEIPGCFAVVLANQNSGEIRTRKKLVSVVFLFDQMLCGELVVAAVYVCPGNSYRGQFLEFLDLPPSQSQVKRLARTAACPRGKTSRKLGFSSTKDGTTPVQLIHDYTEQ